MGNVAALIGATLNKDITTTNGMKYYQLKRAAEDRKR